MGRSGGGGVVLGAPVAEPALPRFAKLTAVLPAPALHPAPRRETLRFTFHGQHISRATARLGAPVLPPPHTLPNTPLHRNESPGGSDHLRQSLVFSIGLLIHITRRASASATACARDWKLTTLLRGSAGLIADRTLKELMEQPLQQRSQNRRRRIGPHTHKQAVSLFVRAPRCYLSRCAPIENRGTRPA